MDNSGTQNTNMMNGNNQASPFAPVDLPDLNSIPTPSTMPPMGNLVGGYGNEAYAAGAGGYGGAAGYSDAGYSNAGTYSGAGVTGAASGAVGGASATGMSGATAGATSATGAVDAANATNDNLMARAGFGGEADEVMQMNAAMKGAGTKEMAEAEAARIAEYEAKKMAKAVEGAAGAAGSSAAQAGSAVKPGATGVGSAAGAAGANKAGEAGKVTGGTAGVNKTTGAVGSEKTVSGVTGTAGAKAGQSVTEKSVTQKKEGAAAGSGSAGNTGGTTTGKSATGSTAAGSGAIGGASSADAGGSAAGSMVKDVGVGSTSLPEKKTTTEDRVAIESLLEECIRHGASDLHIQAGLPPILRIDGALRPMTMYPILTNELVQELVFATLDEDQKKILLKDKEFDYSFAFGDLGRFRVNAFHEKGNMAAAFRLIPNVIKTIEELGLPGVVSSMADHPNGLVLVTGPTGSGKSTTLAALINKINTEKAEHIITIEDPIEFTHTSKRSVVAQREVHYDTFSFAAALRSILREDPDVVLIGEMRDLETIQAAITVAETGHLVFATLHTNSAAQSIDRMVDVFPAHQQPQIRAQLANILVGICSQRLVPAIDGGRVCVAEIMLSNAAVKSIIREGKTHQLDMTIQTGAEQGMQTMDRELAKYVKAGIISYDVAREYTVDTTEFDRLARG